MDTAPAGADEEGRGVRYTTIAALLRLSKCRSMYLVGKALGDSHPTDAAWQTFLNDPETMEQLEALADVAEDIRTAMQAAMAVDPEAVSRVVSQHYARGLESILIIAEDHNVDPEDLLNILVND